VLSEIGAVTRGLKREMLRSLWPSERRPRLRRTRRLASVRGLARVGLALAAVAMALALVGTGAVMVMLASGPIDLESLKPSLTQGLQERIGPGYRVSIASTFLTRGPYGLGVGFGAIEIRDSAGRVVVAAPGGKVGLDAFALLGLEVKVRRLELEGLTVALRVKPDGGLSVAAADSQDAASIELMAPRHSAAPTPDLPILAAGLIDALTGSAQALDRVSLVNGRLQVENQALNKTSVYEDFRVLYQRDGESARVAVSARGPSGPWSVTVNARGGAERGVGVEARDLGLEDLLLLSTNRPPFDSDMPLSLRFEASLEPTGGIRALSGGFSLGAGYFKLDDPDHEPFLLDEATGRISWDSAASRYRLDKMEALAGASHYKIAGWLAPPGAADAPWRGHLESNDTVLAGERPGEQPVTIDRADFDAHYLSSESSFTLDRFAVHGPHLKGEMSAQFAVTDKGPALKMDMRLGTSGLADVMRLWPTFINPDARNWCLEHIKGGDLAFGTMKVDFDAQAIDSVAHKRPVPPDSVRGDFAFKDAAIDVLPGLPSLTGLDVAGFITGHVFSVTAKHGAMDFGSGRRMQANDLFFNVPDTSPAPVVASKAGARVQGAADALADFLSRDSIKRYAGFSVDPATVKGQFQGQLTIDLGLGKSVRPEDQRFHVDGSLSDLKLDKFMANERFEQGALDVVAEPGSLKINGQGLINGLATKVELAKGAADEGTLTLNLTLDDAARAKLGMTGGPSITGPMPVRLKAPLNKSGADVEVDLSRVDIGSPDGASLKPAGKPGKATFSIKQGPDGISITGLAIDAGSIMARGAAQFGTDGAFQSAKLTQLRLNPQDDLKLDLAGGPTMKASVRGAAFDARSLVKSLLSHDPNNGGSKDLDIDVKIGAVGGANKQSISGFELTAAKRGGVLKSLSAVGRLGDGAFSARKSEDGVMTVRAEDAGALAKFLDIYSKLEGGALELTMRDGARGSVGAASVRKFTLRDEPALRRMAAASPVSVGRGEATTPAAAIADGDAVRFDRMTVDFTRSAGRLEVRDALIYNSLVGLTTQGFIDFARDRVDLNGTFVPAYQLNSFVTHIPVFGLLLGGGQHEGIFGVNYRISGLASSPTLTVNPLSGVTPGILRKFFGVLDGTTPTPAPNAYAPAQ
jgi:hypothetical protein